jgi:hydroxycarboxylate dehydrogenase B
MAADTHLIALPSLQTAMRLLVQGFGSSELEVLQVTNNLIEANLTGHDSHGIGMLPRYADAYLEGGLKPNAHISTTLDSGALLRIDGNAGFGQVVGHEAMALAAQRAHQHGSCVVALGNAHHLGRIGAWAEQVAAQGLVSLHLVNVIARPIVAPHGGAAARFGTNPFCAGVPLPGRPPVILDFATSGVAQGKVRVAHNKGEAVAEGLLIDDQGRATTDPRYGVVPPLGALLTFGGHKGYGLALMCELLGGALAGGMTQRNEDTGQKRVLNGMFSVLLNPAALGNAAQFESEALAFLASVQNTATREGDGKGNGPSPVQVAGDAERHSRAARTAGGVPVDHTTWQEILDAAAKLGLDPAGIHRAAGLT